MNLIEGFKIDVPGQELKHHLMDRATYHSDKGQEYAEQARGVAALQAPSGASNDPVSSLQQSARQHSDKANLFLFMANHVLTDATYRLSERDLAYTEIVLDRW